MSIWQQPLTLNGTALDDQAQFGIQVQITPIGGSTVHRLSDGSAVKQTVWTRRRVTLSATGWVPPALDAIDWSAPVTVSGQTLTSPITGFSDGPSESRSPQTADWGWQLTIEES